jgi:hypothetical protein
MTKIRLTLYELRALIPGLKVALDASAQSV